MYNFQLKLNEILDVRILNTDNHFLQVQMTHYPFKKFKIHMKNISDFFINDLKDFFEINQIIKCKVIQDPLTQQLILSYKACNDDLIYFHNIKYLKETKSGYDILYENIYNWIEEEWDRNFKND